MSLTPDELERRRQFVTATDVPKLFRKSPWGNEADVFASKVYGVEFKGNHATEAGSLLEPAVVAWAHQQLGGVVSGDWRIHENGINACSLDAMTVDGEPVEAKTSGIVGPGTPHQWGAEGTDEIPEYYLLQVHSQLLVTGARRAWVPALIGGRGFVMYVVQANPALNAAIARTSEQFWHEHILTREPPGDAVPQLETLKHLRREPGKSITIADELAAAHLAAAQVAKEANEAADAAKALLLTALGDAEVGEYSGGTFTYRQQTQQRKAQEAKVISFPVLRHSAAKKGLVSA